MHCKLHVCAWLAAILMASGAASAAQGSAHGKAHGATHRQSQLPGAATCMPHAALHIRECQLKPYLAARATSCNAGWTPSNSDGANLINGRHSGFTSRHGFWTVRCVTVHSQPFWFWLYPDLKCAPSASVLVKPVPVSSVPVSGPW
jgi:hypothetical protein